MNFYGYDISSTVEYPKRMDFELQLKFTECYSISLNLKELLEFILESPEQKKYYVFSRVGISQKW